MIEVPFRAFYMCETLVITIWQKVDILIFLLFKVIYNHYRITFFIYKLDFCR